MKISNTNNSLNINDGLDLRKVMLSLLEHVKLIVAIPIICALLAYLYTSSSKFFPVTQNYIIEASVKEPNKESVNTIVTKMGLKDETSSSIFLQFLHNLDSNILQEKVLSEENSLTAIEKDSIDIDSLLISKMPAIAQEDIKGVKRSISAIGSNPKVIIRFLNKLISSAKIKTFSDITALSIQNNTLRINEISNRLIALSSIEKNQRISEISKIKESDAESIRVLNDAIYRARFEAKQERLNLIKLLKDEAILANYVGIVDNNINNVRLNATQGDSVYEIFLDGTFPEWYVYGSKALLKKIEILEKRTNDDPYIEDLLIMQNKLHEVRNNNKLRTLQNRIDDTLFIKNFIPLENELLKLKQFDPIDFKFNVMELMKTAHSKALPQKQINKKLITVLVFFGSLLVSIFIAMLLIFYKSLKDPIN